MPAHAANSRRGAAFSSSSAAGVQRKPLMRPMRVSVSRATGSHNSAEAPAASIAIAPSLDCEHRRLYRGGRQARSKHLGQIEASASV